MLRIDNLIDDAKCYESVRQLRWPEGVRCPWCKSDQIKKRGMPYWADPRRSEAQQINHHDGGRGVYFGDSYTNVGWEIITRPYGSGPRGEQTNVDETGQLRPDVSQGDERDE